MASQAKSGKLVLLKIESATPGTYEAVLSARSNSFSINHSVIDVSSKADAGWSAILSGGGITSFETTLSGVFLDSTYDNKLRGFGMSGESFPFELVTSNGDKFSGNVIATSMSVGGEYDGAETYDFSLQNDGEITFTPAP